MKIEGSEINGQKVQKGLSTEQVLENHLYPGGNPNKGLTEKSQK